MVVPGGSDGKVSASNAGDPSWIPGLGRPPGEGNGYLLQYSGLEKFPGQRSLVGYHPWGHRESDTTELLTLSLSHGEYCFIYSDLLSIPLGIF